MKLNKFKLILTSIVICLAVTGCVKKAPIESFPQSMLKASPTETICIKYYMTTKENRFTTKSRSEIEAEMKLRGLTDQELSLSRQNKIVIGMSRNALIASWGMPLDINTTVTKNYKKEQFCYGNKGRFGVKSYSTFVYIKNGKIFSLQDFK